MKSNKEKELLKQQIEKFEEFQKNHFNQLCTCEDRDVYIAGKYFITKATTEYKDCLACNTKRYIK